MTHDSQSNSILGIPQQRRLKLKSREQKVNRTSKGLPKDLLSLMIKSSDFNNTMTISNLRVLPSSNKNKSLLKKNDTPFKGPETPSRRMS